MTANNICLDNVGKYVIYGNGKKLCELEKLVPYKMHENRFGNQQIEEMHYNYSIEKFTLVNGIKQARKENLNRKDNYFLTYDEKYWCGKSLALYIHESEIGVEKLGDILAMETEEEKNYLASFRLNFKNPVNIKSYHVERIFCDGSWTIPDGGKWSTTYGTVNCPHYDTFDSNNSLFCKRHGIKESGVIKRWTEDETHETFSMLTTERYYTKREYSEERLRKDALADALNNSKLFSNTFSHYDIDKFEKVFGKLSITN